MSFEFRVPSSGFEFRVPSWEFRVSSCEFRVAGFGFQVCYPGARFQVDMKEGPLSLKLRGARSG
jgi:hypothetical protein